MIRINNYLTDLNYTNLSSYTPGVYWYIYVPSGIITSGIAVSDSYNSGYLIDATDISNSDLGHNVGWEFYVAPSGSETLFNQLKKDINFILYNNRLTPYRLASNDKIQLKIQLYSEKLKALYIPNVPISLYLNYSGTWQKYTDTITNRNGCQEIIYDCSTISDINYCNAFISGLYNNYSYFSNMIRINFKD